MSIYIYDQSNMGQNIKNQYILDFFRVLGVRYIHLSNYLLVLNIKDEFKKYQKVPLLG